jgi:transcriptional regulator with XRE-family HTH domain
LKIIGYTLSTVAKNKAADQKKVGVQIGALCIKKGISVTEIARVAGVSTVTVYAWFSGLYSPREALTKKLFKHIEKF